ncbi:MAG TPA: mucoidy inhibitor MuiA family protein [Geothrix sp.]|nr:mucoidy inhibitor MuiA family protein [Geothrix sp.]
MRRIFFFSTLTLCLAAQAPMAVQAPIRRVRLHPDEAWVTRIGKTTLAEAGTHRLQLSDLPTGLGLEDLQVSAKGPAGTRLGDVAVRAEPREVTETPEWKKLEADREALKVRRDTMESQLESIRQEQTFLKGIMATHDKELSGRLTYTLPNAATIVELARNVQIRLSALMFQDRQLKRDLERLALEETRLNGELRQRQGQQRTAPSRVTVELTTPAPGAVVLEVSYRQRQARWTPVYEARLAEDRTTLGLALYAAVVQTTGESWDGVRLEISNAKPGRSLSTPSFDGPQELSWQPPMPREMSLGGVAGGVPGGVIGGVVGGVVGGTGVHKDYAEEATMAPPPPPPPPPDALEAMATTLDEASGLATTFALEGPKDIPTDGQPHRFKVLAQDLKPQMKVIALPRLEATAYQVAQFTAPEQFPLFPQAPVVQFAGTQRLGQAPLQIPATGQPFQLSFGPVKGLRVSFRRLEHKLETVGAFTKQRQWTLKEALALSNDTSEPMEVEVQDRLLKSTVEAVKITSLPETTPGAVERQPGVQAWTLKVPKGQTSTVTEATQIRAPQDGEVEGLEDLN